MSPSKGYERNWLWCVCRDPAYGLLWETNIRAEVSKTMGQPYEVLKMEDYSPMKLKVQISQNKSELLCSMSSERLM